MTLISEFILRVKKIHATGNATEHSYRSAFEALFSGLGVTALNEPKREKCGAPDFMISRGDIVIGHVEAKDPHIGIRGMKGSNKSQQDRYRAALPNLIYTNGLDWNFYRDGDPTASVTIANILEGVTPRPDQYDKLENLLRDFIIQKPQTITSPRDLAERMAGKANLIKDVLSKILADNEAQEAELMDQYQAFKENLIHDITPDDFADIYAETIAYGMFAARLHDITLDTFSRQEALELLPRSNPFLRSLFTYVAGHDLDERITWIIDDLARVFRPPQRSELDSGRMAVRHGSRLPAGPEGARAAGGRACGRRRFRVFGGCGRIFRPFGRACPARGRSGASRSVASGSGGAPSRARTVRRSRRESVNGNPDSVPCADGPAAVRWPAVS